MNCVQHALFRTRFPVKICCATEFYVVGTERLYHANSSLSVQIHFSYVYRCFFIYLYAPQVIYSHRWDLLLTCGYETEALAWNLTTYKVKACPLNCICVFSRCALFRLTTKSHLFPRVRSNWTARLTQLTLCCCHRMRYSDGVVSVSKALERQFLFL